MNSLLKGVADEMGDDVKKNRSPEERTLHAVAQRLLVLERDLKAPGAARSATERVDRILEAIAKEKF